MRNPLVMTCAALAVLATGMPAAKAAISEDVATVVDQFDPVSYALFKGLRYPGSGLPFLLKRDYAAAFEYYQRTNFEPLWHENGVASSKAREIAELLARAREHGMNPARYPVFLSETETTSSREIAAADILLTLSVLEYGRHAAAGRITPEQVSKTISLKPVLPDPIAILASVAESETPSDTLENLHPQNAQYKALRAALLKEIAPRKETKAIKVPSDRVLKPGVKDPRVAVLRHRLGILEALTANDFNADVKAAVVAFQKENGLSPDGVVGPRTAAVLNGEALIDRTEVLIANMERWRWMPRELGKDHVFVNIPHYTVRVQRNGEEVYQGRVVVGKTRHKTPVFSDEMEHVVVNPYWNVPSSIARNEILPKLIGDPNYGYKYEIAHASGRRVDPFAVDWSQYAGGRLPYSFRQPPGRRNALGSIKFLFPNKHSVYLHDTPSRSLFSRNERAFSHGCVRLHEPMVFADAIFNDDARWNSSRLKKMVGGKESWINLATKIPVHLTYFTAWADEDGAVSYRRDIYGHDGTTTAALTR